MARSNAERQQAYRKRKIGPGGRHERINCLIGIATKRKLERLAIHFGYTITKTIERLIEERTVSVCDQLNDCEREAFLEGRPIRMSCSGGPIAE